ncbi:hypothetical protein GCM10009839_46260 [Catenulispora yoronensis]|uniref:YiaAB two helix domain-containing protein n=1 Tax=Catenulispora yoronensis TaxID=450799 RepID=A0ABP5G9S3_9ACTN
MSTPLATRNTAAYYFQAVASFIASTGATTIGIAYLPVNAWERAFLALGLLYTITSAITLSKVVRDKQEEAHLVGRVDRARLDKLLTEHNPFNETV